MFSLPRTKSFNFGILVAVLEALSAIALIATSAFLISRASEQPPILYLMMAVVGVRALSLGRAFFRYVQRLVLHDATFTHLASIRPLVFEKYAALAPSKIAGSTGEQLARATDQVEELQNYPIRVFAPLVQAFAALSGTTLIIGIWFPESALANLLTAVLAFVLGQQLSMRLSSKSEALRSDLVSSLRAELVEYAQSAELIEAYGWSARFKQRIHQIGSEIERLDSKAAWGIGANSSVFSLFAVVAASLSGYLAAPHLDSAPGYLLAVAVLTPLALFELMAMAANTHASHARYAGAKKSLSKLMEMPVPHNVNLPSGGVSIEDFDELRASGSVSFEGRRVDINEFRLRRGEFVLISGKSGSGKSTLGYVLSSMYQLDGSFEINSKPADEFSLESRHALIGYCEQQAQLFPGTLGANLSISGIEDRLQQQAIIERLGLAEELSGRGGLDLELGGRGSGLSGGQAQRVAIARALLRGAKVLVLDEPTSGLDWDNALRLMRLLRELADSGIAIVLITHDPQLRSFADREFRIS